MMLDGNSARPPSLMMSCTEYTWLYVALLTYQK